MKMLTRDGNKARLESLKELLENKGIPAVIQGENTARMIIPFLVFEPTLWVYLDEQFEDATSLMKNPDHKVLTGIDVDEFYLSMDEFSSNKAGFNKVYIDLAKFFISILVVMFIIILALNNL